ncbi:phytochrome sensor signal transduction histidine kinase [Arboricoccus pini]|uniref:histidine kinase n=1 Tax=Arboricoccus pini TaxID=1963835 RepID=A0A212R644_9PROT|nr:ATP-binding protein [Arboricoccus pini]SNB67636.1 phytochrome sensor signal transduction histidine kinase [Arboricoccus pini]
MTPEAPLDIEACVREPIYNPGTIQPHGTLLVLDPSTFRVVQRARNQVEFLGCDDLLDQELDGSPGLGSLLVERLRAWRTADEPVLLTSILHQHRRLQVAANRTAQGILVEIEASEEGHPTEAFYSRMGHVLDILGSASDIPGAGAIATRELRHLTGFDRALLYRFDRAWNGTVIAEDGNGRLPSYMGLRFPAGDFPPQARALYKKSRLRLISDKDHIPVPIEPLLSPLDGKPLDLGATTLRSVSPIDLEYMRNMGTAASMSTAILLDGELWGFLVCHHTEPRHLGTSLRAACDLLGQLIAQRIGAIERMAQRGDRLARQRLKGALLKGISREGGFETGLVRHGDIWLRLARAEGASLVTQENVYSVGRTPPSSVTQRLAILLQQRGVKDLLATEQLSSFAPEFEPHADTAAGMLALPISQLHASYLIWYRPEVIQTVRWARAAAKPRTAGERLTSRASFAQWTELVRLRSEVWSQVDIEAVGSLRSSIVDFVLKRAEERAALTSELERSNHELESFSYSISHDLRAPFRHIVSYAELMGERLPELDETSRHYLDTISAAALAAGRLVDDLLRFSQLGRASLSLHPIDMQKLLNEVLHALEPDAAGRQVDWRVGDLPPAWGDTPLVRQAVHNLMENALKYTRKRDLAVISVEGRQKDQTTVYRITDNGVGFDMRHVGKLFGVFQRLHRVEDFEGSGIGLAITKRVIDRHGGWIRAEGELDKGASFTFALPRQEQKEVPSR